VTLRPDSDTTGLMINDTPSEASTVAHRRPPLPAALAPTWVDDVSLSNCPIVRWFRSRTPTSPHLH